MLFTRRSFIRLSTAAALSSGRAAALRTSHPTDPSSSVCGKLAVDPLRPQYHLIPDHNWMNDPNGPIFYNGRYHMFHQYNPQGATWGNMNWAHASSPDIIHWRHEQVALSPTPSGPVLFRRGRPGPARRGRATARPPGRPTRRGFSDLASVDSPVPVRTRPQAATPGLEPARLPAPLRREKTSRGPSSSGGRLPRRGTPLPDEPRPEGITSGGTATRSRSPLRA